MENQENEMEQEEMSNPEHFKSGQVPEKDKLHQEDELQYTEDETKFADGKGTQLEEEFDAPEKEDVDNDIQSDLDDAALDQKED